jgi:hypothetical protein
MALRKVTPRRNGLRTAHPGSTWVSRLERWRQLTTQLAMLSGSLALIFYSWTVYTQNRWNQQYQALQQLRDHERLFRLTIESNANSRRERVSQLQWVPLGPERMVEVPARSFSFSVPDSQKPETPHPIGY